MLSVKRGITIFVLTETIAHLACSTNAVISIDRWGCGGSGDRLVIFSPRVQEPHACTQNYSK
ncbi:MAG: hypothetical protein M1387_11850 [Thaumarchaeota archaeon]|nr:hypothetical protein [Nitrososphaerota archaeon]